MTVERAFDDLLAKEFAALEEAAGQAGHFSLAFGNATPADAPPSSSVQLVPVALT
jgi:hypothetical protein